MGNSMARSKAWYISGIFSSNPNPNTLDIFLEEESFFSTFSIASFQQLDSEEEAHGDAKQDIGGSEPQNTDF